MVRPSRLAFSSDQIDRVFMQLISQEGLEKLDPLKKSEHPDQVLVRLLSFVDSIGSVKFLTGAGYNKERDLLVAILFAYAIRKWSRREWFIQQLTDEPPDFYLISPSDRPFSERPVDRAGIEIVEIRTGEPQEAIQIIQRTKIENYLPPRRTFLLIFLNTRQAVRVGLELSRWALQNPEKFRHFSEVYFLYLISFSPITTWTYRILNLFKHWYQICVLSEEFNKGIIFPHPLIDKHQVKIR